MNQRIPKRVRIYDEDLEKALDNLQAAWYTSGVASTDTIESKENTMTQATDAMATMTVKEKVQQVLDLVIPTLAKGVVINADLVLENAHVSMGLNRRQVNDGLRALGVQGHAVKGRKTVFN